MYNKVNAGFRCNRELYQELRDISIKENRSIANILHIMVDEQVKRYNLGGFKSIYENKNNE